MGCYASSAYFCGIVEENYGPMFPEFPGKGVIFEGKCPLELSWLDVWIPMKDYKVLHVAVPPWLIHKTHTHGQVF